MVPIIETAARVINRKIVSFSEQKNAIIGDEPDLFLFFTFYTFLILFSFATITIHDCQEKMNCYHEPMKNLSHLSDKVNKKFSLLPGKVFTTFL
jgi:hypothetical protein